MARLKGNTMIADIVLIAVIACWLSVALGGCVSPEQVEAIPAVSALLDQAEAALDAAIAEEESRIAALEAAPVVAPGSPESDTIPETDQDIPEGTRWLHGGGQVAGWPVTAHLSRVDIAGGRVTLDYDKANVWPVANVEGGTVANPWVIVNVGGQWYAATWEWLKPGQTVKDMRSKSWGGHIKAAPLSKWEPKSGDRIGWMVSGLARSAIRNVRERSNIVWKEWP